MTHKDSDKLIPHYWSIFMKKLDEELRDLDVHETQRTYVPPGSRKSRLGSPAPPNMMMVPTGKRFGPTNADRHSERVVVSCVICDDSYSNTPEYLIVVGIPGPGIKVRCKKMFVLCCKNGKLLPQGHQEHNKCSGVRSISQPGSYWIRTSISIH